MINQQFWPTNPFYQLYHQYQRLGQAFSQVQQENLILENSLTQQILLKQSLIQHQQRHSPTQQHLQISIEDNRRVQKKRAITKLNKNRLNRAQPYVCPYQNCPRIYKSSIALNLHIKINHNGGTKKERQTYAKHLIDSEEGLCSRPESKLNLPPNFLDEFRKTYSYTKKYNM